MTVKTGSRERARNRYLNTYLEMFLGIHWFWTKERMMVIDRHTFIHSHILTLKSVYTTEAKKLLELKALEGKDKAQDGRECQGYVLEMFLESL